MPRYYFSVMYGTPFHDTDGCECDDIEAVKDEAFKCSSELLKDVRPDSLWSGEPWVLRVADQPNGDGNTVLELTFSATVPPSQ